MVPGRRAQTLLPSLQKTEEAGARFPPTQPRLLGFSILNRSDRIMAANKGAKHHAAKMTEATVKAARKAYDSGTFIMVDGKRSPVTVNALARKYGVAHQTMHALLKRKTWQHVQ